MAQGTCSVAGCERPAKTRGWCVTHYGRWKLHGEPGPAAIQHRSHARRGCSVEGCTAQHMGLGYCQTHLYRFRSSGDPLVTRPPGSPAGEANPKRQGADISYSAAHHRVKRMRGKASTHGCTGCGLGAHEWALRHDASSRIFDAQVGHDFSPDVNDYTPLCRSCHWHYDRDVLLEDLHERMPRLS